MKLKVLFLVVFSVLLLSGCEDDKEAKKAAAKKAEKEYLCKQFKNC
jgi:PBP1b-binding outer membrane lipoprotein LpoB